MAGWIFFLIHYFHCTFVEAFDPATVGMKLAFRLYTLIVVGAVLDWWLQRRKAKDILERTGAQDISSTGEESADFSKTDKPMRRAS